MFLMKYLGVKKPPRGFDVKESRIGVVGAGMVSYGQEFEVETEAQARELLCETEHEFDMAYTVLDPSSVPGEEAAEEPPAKKSKRATLPGEDAKASKEKADASLETGKAPEAISAGKDEESGIEKAPGETA